MLLSPGPQKYNFSVLKSKTARFFRRDCKPSKPGKLESVIDGMFRTPLLDLLGSSACRKETGNAQSYSHDWEPLPTPLTLRGDRRF